MIKDIAKIIDHTNINPSSTEKDIKETCKEAKRYNFRAVCCNPEYVKLVSKELKGTKIKTVVLCDPPMGLSPHLKRVQMCKEAKKNGADEIDIVMNIIDMKYERYDDILNDLKEIAKILPTKVIIGSGYLTDKEIIRASELVKEAGAFCVKTATEKDPLEHIELKEKARHLKLMRKGAPGLKIKAAGKIRSYRDFLMMVDAGADIIGSSSSLNIIKGYKKHKALHPPKKRTGSKKKTKNDSLKIR
ncbi:deoxyribose-phosphate aldolase [bacterium]|nr:deoxyribose-phosphate aldolase [bacterium]